MIVKVEMMLEIDPAAWARGDHGIEPTAQDVRKWVTECLTVAPGGPAQHGACKTVLATTATSA